jgi:DNA invertase Pin-like site-specific DNA recombinase
VSSTPRRRRRISNSSTAGIVAYVRVSTDEQAASGLGLEAQRAAIAVEAGRRGLPVLAEYADEGVSGAKHDRPGLDAALDALDRGEGSVLLVSKLDRLSRSVPLVYDVMDRSRRGQWALVALDLNVDTSTPAGEMLSGVASVFAQFERRLISQRTKDALAAKKAQGVRLGRPSTVGADARARIVALRGEGKSWRAVADAMTNEGWPTGHGAANWLANTCRRIYDAEQAA